MKYLYLCISLLLINCSGAKPEEKPEINHGEISNKPLVVNTAEDVLQYFHEERISFRVLSPSGTFIGNLFYDKDNITNNKNFSKYGPTIFNNPSISTGRMENMSAYKANDKEYIQFTVTWMYELDRAESDQHKPSESYSVLVSLDEIKKQIQEKSFISERLKQLVAIIVTPYTEKRVINIIKRVENQDYF